MANSFIILQPQGCNVKMKGRINPKEVPPIISSHIKRVEVVCGVIDERLIEFFKFLRGTLNISMLANNTLVPLTLIHVGQTKKKFKLEVNEEMSYCLLRY